MIQIFEVIVVPIVVALITAGAGAFAVVRHHRRDVRELRNENTDQHNMNAGLLQHLSSQVGGIDRKIDRLDHRVDSLAVWAAEHEKTHLLDDQGSL